MKIGKRASGVMSEWSEEQHPRGEHGKFVTAEDRGAGALRTITERRLDHDTEGARDVAADIDDAAAMTRTGQEALELAYVDERSAAHSHTSGTVSDAYQHDMWGDEVLWAGGKFDADVLTADAKNRRSRFAGVLDRRGLTAIGPPFIYLSSDWPEYVTKNVRQLPVAIGVEVRTEAGEEYEETDFWEDDPDTFLKADLRMDMIEGGFDQGDIESASIALEERFGFRAGSLDRQ